MQTFEDRYTKKPMRIYLLIITLISSLNVLQAQTSKGKIFGSVVDVNTKVPLEYSTILLKNKKTNATIGGLSDEKGKFNIENISFGEYILEISYLGYDAYTNENINLSPNNTFINLGEVKMRESANELEVVEVVGEKSMFQLGGEKKIFNVDKSAISAGGNAIDAMKQIPTLDVSIDGNLTLRGSESIIIYINGKPSGMTAESKQAILQSLPANSIESIEIITNPSSKYDADGSSGIINIVLKKNYNRGLNGSANAGYSTKYKNNAGVSLNFKKKKINFTSGLNYRFNESYGGGDGERKNILADYTNYFNTYDRSDEKRWNTSANVGLDIDITPKANFSIAHIFTAGFGNEDGINESKFLDANQIYYGGFIRTSDIGFKRINNNTNLIYTQKFKSPGQYMNVSANFEISNTNRDVDYMQNNFDADGNHLELLPDQEYNNNINNNYVGIFQTDYTHPFEKHGQLEIGGKMSYRLLASEFIADTLDRSTSEMVPDDDLNNKFDYKENVNAAYASFGGKHKDFNYKVGMRMEQSNINISNNQFDTTYKKSYVDFFPSVFVSQRLPKNHEVQLSYTYRINRPNPWMLNPFANYDDPLNIRKGNPFLDPEYINALEFTYLKNWNATFLTASVYYRQSNQGFARGREIDPETSVATLSWYNLNKTKSAGSEIIFRTPITKWWNIMLNANLFYLNMNGEIPGELTQTSTENFQWNGRAMTTFKFWKNAEIQLSYRYNSKMEYLQGYIKPMHGLDIGAKKDFLKNKATLALNVSDIFNTRVFEIVNNGSTFESISTRRWESRVFTINFSYRFGKSENAPRRRMQEGMPSGGEQMMDF